MSRIVRWLSLAGVLAAAALAAGCGGGGSSSSFEESDPAELVSATAKPTAVTQFVGKVDGTDAYIAVVDNRDGTVTVYVCNGNYDISAWLPGELTGKGFDLSSGTGVTVSGSIASDVASGTVTLADGSKHAFSAERSSAPAGLFELVNVEEGKVVRAATVVLPDRTSRGGRTSSLTDVQCQSLKSSWKASKKLADSFDLAADGGFEAFQDVVDGMWSLSARYQKGGCSGNIWD